MNIVNFTEDEQSTVWIGATRYYLGRTTYAVGDFCRALIRHWPTLTEHTRATIKRDVEEEFERDDRARRPKSNTIMMPLGRDCDRAEWEKVRELWKEEGGRRKEEGKYRVRWWAQDTLESGHWELSGVLGLYSARKLVESGHYSEPRIVLDEPEFPFYEPEALDAAMAGGE